MNKFFGKYNGTNNKKEDSRGNDKVTNTFVPAVFFQTSLRFLQTIVPINTRVNCSSLTGAAALDVPSRQITRRKQFNELAGKKNVKNC